MNFTEKEIRQLFALEKKLRERGHHLFISYSPHVYKPFHIQLYVGGWKDHLNNTETQVFQECKNFDWAGDKKGSLGALVLEIKRYAKVVGAL